VKQTHLWKRLARKELPQRCSRKRGISKTHARALADYFHVPADLFILVLIDPVVFWNLIRLP